MLRRGGSIPLIGLLGALAGWIEHRHMALLTEAGFDDLRPAHNAVAINVPAGGIRLTDLAATAGTSKQAMAELVNELVDNGYLRRVVAGRQGQASAGGPRVAPSAVHPRGTDVPRRPAVTVGLVAVVVLLIAAIRWNGEAPPSDVTGPPHADDPMAMSPRGGALDGPSVDVGDGSEAAAEPAAGGGRLSMWARGGLDQDVARRASQLPDVVEATFVQDETVGLVGSHHADGHPVDVLEEGFRIPIGIVAVDPASYAVTLATPQARDLLVGLRPGEVVLSETSAGLRRVGVGGALDLDGRPGLRVAGVLPDGAVGWAEVIVHVADAEALGLSGRGAVVIRHTATTDAAVQTLVGALEALAPPDAPVRIAGAGTGSGRQTAPLVLSLVEVKQRFGEFAYRPRAGTRDIDIDPAFLDEHIVTVSVPVLGNVRCHRDIIDDLRAVLAEIVEAGLADSLDPARYGGCYHPRRISSGRDRLSRHAWGIAIDINVDLSLPGLGAVPPDEVIEIFGRHGFRWGGDFIQPDNHHFEWLGPEAIHRPQR